MPFTGVMSHTRQHMAAKLQINMEYLTTQHMMLFAAYSAFHATLQFLAKDYKGASVMFGFVVSLWAMAGMIAGVGYLFWFAATASLMGALILFAIGFAAKFVAIPMSAMNPFAAIVGIFAMPVLLYQMVKI